MGHNIFSWKGRGGKLRNQWQSIRQCNFFPIQSLFWSQAPGCVSLQSRQSQSLLPLLRWHRWVCFVNLQEGRVCSPMMGVELLRRKRRRTFVCLLLAAYPQRVLLSVPWLIFCFLFVHVYFIPPFPCKIVGSTVIVFIVALFFCGNKTFLEILLLSSSLANNSQILFIVAWRTFEIFPWLKRLLQSKHPVF